MKKVGVTEYLRKTAHIIAFVSLMCVLTVTAVEAGPPVAGCDPAITAVQKNQADAMRVRDKAYAMALIKKNDPSLGMTCFDKAMGVTARLGNMFSDKTNVTSAITGIVNTAVFSGGAGDTATSIAKMFMGPGGAGNLLINNLSTVVSPGLKEFLGDFTDLLGGPLSFIGGIVNPFFDALDAIVGAVNSGLATITTAVGTATAQIDDALNLINQIVTIANQLGIALPQTVVLTVTAALKAVKAAINAALAAATAAVTAAINSVMATIKGFMDSMINLTCDNIQKLWDDNDPTNAMKSVEGSGIEDGTPYFDYRVLLGGSPAGVGAAVRGELDNPFNQTVLNNALNDLNNMLNAPCGGLKSWKSPPTITANTSVANILALMADPCP